MSGRTGGLRRHADFRRLLLAQSVSNVGSEVSLLAVPLVAVVALDASIFEVALLTTVERIAFLLVGLPAGVWCDRLRRRPVLITADLVRAGALGAVSVSAGLGTLSLAQLYAAVAVVGVATVFFDVAYQSYLPGLVGREHVLEGTAKLEASRTVAYTVGPGLAGVLVQVASATGALALDAASFLWSGAWLARIRAVEPDPPARAAGVRPSLGRDVLTGLRFVFGHPYLRPIAVYGATLVLFNSAQRAIVVVFLTRTLGVSAGTVGLLITATSGGAIAGAALARPLARRFGDARTIVAVTLGGGVLGLLVPLAHRGPALAAFVVGGAGSALSVVVFNILQVGFRQLVTPAELLSRMNATMRFVLWGAAPVGGLLGGVAAAALGVRGAMWVSAAGALLSVGWLLASPLRTRRSLPTGVGSP